MIAVAVTVIGLLVVNASQRAPVPVGSALFHEWSEGVEAALLRPRDTADPPPPQLTFSVDLATADNTDSWLLAVESAGSPGAAGSTPNGPPSTRVSSNAATRLLALAREAKVFSPAGPREGQPPLSAGKEQAIVRIAQGTQAFAATLDPSTLRGNMPALSLVTLLREYRNAGSAPAGNTPPLHTTP